MLVLVTNRADLTADYLVLELERRGASFVRFNTEDYPTKTTLNWTEADAELVVGGERLARSEIDAVWWRRPLPPHMPDGLSEAQARWAAGEARVAIDGFWRTLDARWVNLPVANAAAENKVEQLARAASTGFCIPPTLVTNDRAAVRRFLTAHESVVCKALSSPAVPVAGRADGEEAEHFYTSIITLAAAGQLADLGPEPYLFQALIPKLYDVRVTVIGDDAYACGIESQHIPAAQVDWRLGDIDALPHAAVELPAHLAAQCVTLTHSYGLRYAAIDLALRPDGGYTFFEINPNGQWAWIEHLTGLPLAARLADELLSPR